MRFSTILLSGLALAIATPAVAQDAEPADASAPAPTDPPRELTVTGGATVTTDYRFRGLTQTNEDFAIQGTVNVNHSSGFYVGTWASSIDGGCDGSTPALTCYGGAEVDLYGGFTKTLSSGIGVDVGLLYYYYPGGKNRVNTDYFEPYASLTYTIGPVAAKAGLAYAWGGQDGLDFTTGHDDDIYVYGEGSVGIPTTPITLKGHVGYTSGSLGLANPSAGDDTYWDWSLTAEAVFLGHFKAGVSYVDTDVTDNFRFASRLGRDATVLGYVGVTF